MKNSVKNAQKSSNGITLIALVITIIVLLILAGISISMLSGDNGILQKATDAKEQSGIGQEKEIVALAYNSVLAKKVSNGDSTPVTLEDMNTELTNQGATASGSNPIKVTFTASKRQYTINNGSIEYVGIESNNNQDDDSTEYDYTSLSVGDYISNYPVYYDNVNATSGIDLTPQEKYKGWRVLSTNNGIIKLISAGIPLNFTSRITGSNVYNYSKNLTINFFDNEITYPQQSDYQFYQSGFKTGINGTAVSNINALKELFNNSYTQKYQDGESATYTDTVANKNYSNSNVINYPKVQSLTLEEAREIPDSLLKIDYNDNSLYAPFWLASVWEDDEGEYYLSCIVESGIISAVGTGGYCQGVRVVVTLKSDLKFIESKDKINDTTTWKLK